MFKSKRFRIAVISGIFMFILSTISIFKNMETLAITCVGSFMTILTTYIFQESKRPSNTKEF